MLMIDAEKVHRLLDWSGARSAMAEGHRKPQPKSGRIALEQPNEGFQPNIVIALPAWQANEALGVKVITSFPSNAATEGLQTVNSLYLLFDPMNGKCVAILDGQALIYRKTATDSALGAHFLAPKNAKRLLMIGAGAMAPYVIDAILDVRPTIEEIVVWNRTPARANALVRKLQRDGRTVSVTEHLDAELPKADIIMSATMAEEPLVKGELIAPGAHVGLIGSFTPIMREGDDGLLKRADIYVDDFGCVERSGEFTGPLKDGIITRQDIRGDFFALCREEVSHVASERPTLFKNGGAAHLDLFLASYLLDRLRAGA